MISTKVTVNGVQYESVEAMPPDVRQIYEQAMLQARAAGGSVVKTNEVKFTFEFKGPGFTFRAGAKPMDPSQPVTAELAGRRTSAPGAIEPSNAEAAIRTAIVLVICAAAGLALWFWKLR